MTVNTAEKWQQTFIPILKKKFKSKLVEAFLVADIPLFKLQHPQIHQLFIQLKQPVPPESSCCKHMDKLAVDEKQQLKEHLHNKNTFLIVDESEINGSKYLNILIGDTAVSETTYVLDCSIVETMNQQVVTMKIDNSLKKLDIQRHNFVLLLSYVACYMTACTATLKLLHLQLFHNTCMVHILYNCAEKVRSHFQQVDNLIAKVKMVTMKNKNWQNEFNEISTPLQPVLTRWGTWLNAAEYYTKNLVKVCEIVNAFEGDGILVSNVKAAVNDIAKLLAEIHHDYQVLPKIIQKMESSKYIIKEVHADISALDLKEDCVSVSMYIKKRTLKKCGMESVINLKQEDISPALYAELQFCQPTTAAVEWLFSMLSKLLCKERPFSLENVE